MKSKKYWLVLVGMVLVCVVYVGYERTHPIVPTYETTMVERGVVENVVSVTGRIEPVDRVSLAFTQGGRIAHITVSEGEGVTKGENIAILEQQELLGVVREAQARVRHEDAAFAALVAPLPEEERIIKEVAVTQAEIALQNSVQNVKTVLGHTFAVVDDAVHEKADEVFSNGLKDSVPTFGVRFSYGTSDFFIKGSSQENTSLNEGRRSVEAILALMKSRTELEGVEALMVLQQTEQDLATIDRFLTEVATVVNAYTPQDVNAQTVYRSFQTPLASARSAVSTVRTELRSASTQYEAAQAAHTLAQQEYVRAVTGATDESRAVQMAARDTAQESAAHAQAVLNSSNLYAPFSGMIASVKLSVGEVVGAYEPVAELLTEGVYEVEAYIPEADIARVKIGDRARITFDALPRTEVFEAEVVRISLSETVREGVPTYKTRLILKDEEVSKGSALRPGMTANVDISTDKRESVLSVATRCIVTDANRTYVRVLKADGQLEEREVVTGLRGSEGNTEIVSGLRENEEVVLFVQ